MYQELATNSSLPYEHDKVKRLSPYVSWGYRSAIVDTTLLVDILLHHITRPTRQAMKKNKLLIPDNLDLTEFTYPEETAIFLDMLVYRCYLSNLKSNKWFDKHRKDKAIYYSDRWVTIPSRTLKNINASYTPFIGELIDRGVIKRKPFTKGKAFGYRLTAEYKDRPLSLYLPQKQPTEKHVLRKLKQQEQKFKSSIQKWANKSLEDSKQGTVSTEGYRRTFENIRSISLSYTEEDMNQVLAEIQKGEGIKPVHKRNHLLRKLHEMIESDSSTRVVPFYSIDAYGRFHYFLTNMPKRIRPFVRMNGKRVVGYDITSSQCVFFVLSVSDESKQQIDFDTIRKSINRWSPKFFPELDKFLEDDFNKAKGPDYVISDKTNHKRKVQKHRQGQLEKEIRSLLQELSGDFYEFMMRKSGEKWSSDEEFQKKRKAFKGKFFEFLYGSNRRRTSIFKAFRGLFPYTTMVLWQMKDFEGMYQYWGLRRHVPVLGGIKGGCNRPQRFKSQTRDGKKIKEKSPNGEAVVRSASSQNAENRSGLHVQSNHPPNREEDISSRPRQHPRRKN